MARGVGADPPDRGGPGVGGVGVVGGGVSGEGVIGEGPGGPAGVGWGVGPAGAGCRPARASVCAWRPQRGQLAKAAGLSRPQRQVQRPSMPLQGGTRRCPDLLPRAVAGARGS